MQIKGRGLTGMIGVACMLIRWACSMQMKGAWPAKNADLTITPYIPFTSTNYTSLLFCRASKNIANVSDMQQPTRYR